MFSQRFLSEVNFAQGPSLHGRYPASTVLWPIWLPDSHLDFLAFYTCPPILSSLKELSGPPTFTYPLLLHAMLSDPEDAMYICPWVIYMMLLSGLTTPSAIPQTVLTGLNHFNPKAYGLQYSCLRLTHGVTDVSPRLGTGCVGSTLSWWLFQPLAK